MRSNRNLPLLGPGRALGVAAVALLVPLAATLLPSCDLPTQSCTLVGCQSGIDFALFDAHTAAYTVTIESAEVSGSFECVPPTDPGEELWTTRSFSGDLGQEESALATALCGASSVSLRFLHQDADLPEQLSIEIDGERDVTHTFSGIEYTVSQPNGPDCPPTCSQAELSFDAPT